MSENLSEDSPSLPPFAPWQFYDQTGWACAARDAWAFALNQPHSTYNSVEVAKQGTFRFTGRTFVTQLHFVGSAPRLSVPQSVRGLDRIILTDDYLRPEVSDLCGRGGVSLLVRTGGSHIWVGPGIGIPGGICLECLTFYIGLRRMSAERCGEPADAALGQLEVLAGQWTELGRSTAIIDIDTGRSVRVSFRGRADCDTCRAAPLPIEDNLRILGHALTGILGTRRIEPLMNTGLYAAIGSVLLPPEVELDGVRRLSASGKGRTADDAARSVTLEAAERYSSLFDASECVTLGPAGATAPYPLDSVIQYSSAQYAAGHCGIEPLAPTREILWAPACSATTGRTVAVPAACVYLEYLFEIEPFYNQADTSGCAAGVSREDALHRALLEAVERDALAIWWYNRAARPGLSFAPGELRVHDMALQCLEDHGRDLHLIDLTHDLGVPVVAAVSAGAGGRAIYLGSAADLTVEAAAHRAIEEMLQFWFWDTVQGWVPDSRRDWIEQATCRDFPFLTPRATAPNRAECRSVTGALLSRGFDPLWVDLTRPAVEVPVVRAIVPGLRQYKRRFAPGRLYDVPVKLGWISGPLGEDQLNPFDPPL